MPYPKDDKPYAKVVGYSGYILLMVGIALVAVWLALAAYSNPAGTWVGVAAICVLVIGIASLFVSRMTLTSRDTEDRAEEDPLQPEVTEDEAAEYEAHYHYRDVTRE